MLILAAGVLGGFVRSMIGWANTETTEKFNRMKFTKSIIRAGTAGLVIAYTLQLDPVATFFAAGFGDVLLKEGHSGAKKLLFSN